MLDSLLYSQYNVNNPSVTALCCVHSSHLRKTYLTSGSAHNLWYEINNVCRVIYIVAMLSDMKWYCPPRCYYSPGLLTLLLSQPANHHTHTFPWPRYDDLPHLDFYCMLHRKEFALADVAAEEFLYTLSVIWQSRKMVIHVYHSYDYKHIWQHLMMMPLSFADSILSGNQLYFT